MQELLLEGLKQLKLNLTVQHEDKAMVLEVLRMLFDFVRTTLLTNPKAADFIGFGFMGLHVLSDGCTTKLSPKIGTALHKLTEPEWLSGRAWDVNFLDCMDVFKKIEKHRKALMRTPGDGGSVTRDQAMLDLVGEVQVAAEEQDPEAEAGLSTYKDYQKLMLQVLHPLCDMVDGLLTGQVAARFENQLNKPKSYLEDLKNSLGIVTTIVKVFEPSSEADNSLQLLAVMGPESYGKSTLINHLIHAGRNIDFMPATPGMGTQVVCKIASGVLETFQRTSDTMPRTGRVKDMVEKVNSQMKEKGEALAKKGEVLGIREMEMLRATVPFEAPFRVEFLDVPGTKDATVFHTRVALGLATTLVLVCGKVDNLRAQLSSGCLKLLKTAVAGLSSPIPIQCVVSFCVKESEFNSSKALFIRVLQENFPSCKDLIKEPLFLNFFEAKDDDQRQEMVDSFFTAMATGRRHVMDPYERFLDLRPKITEFTQLLDKFFRTELGDYFRNKIRSQEGAVYKVKRSISVFLANRKQHPVLLGQSFDTSRIQKLLEHVTIGAFPTFQFEVMGEGVAQVRSAAILAQSLLNECRICQMGWLKDSSDNFHRQTFGSVFTELSDLTKSSGPHFDQLFSERLCATFRFCNVKNADDAPPDLQRDQEHESWWIKNCISQIAPYLDATALGCLLAGFYLISGDTKNKNDFLGKFRGRGMLLDEALRTSNTWKQNMINTLDGVDYGQWIAACEEQFGDAEQVAQALFSSIEEASGEFARIATQSGFLDSADNFAIQALVDITFVLMERVFIHVPEASLGNYMNTSFSEHLRREAASVELRRQAPLIRGNDPNVVHAACCDALKLMKQSDRGASKWAAMLRDGILEQQIAEMQKLRSMSAPDKFRSGQDCAMVLVSHDDRKVIMQASLLQGKTHPIAANALPILERRCHSRAPPNDDALFPSFALREIRYLGARVAIFMRRGDQASYDPLESESLLIEKLQGEPNLVTLFVLWTPVHADTPWNTEHYTSRWRSNHPNSCLEVRLVPMDTSFECQSFVEKEVAAAIQQAGTKAMENLTQIREQELELRNAFARSVEDYDADKKLSSNRDTQAFHKAMIEEMRPLLDEARRGIDTVTEPLAIPSAAYNQAHYYVKSLDQLHVAAAPDRGEEASSINELECRSFNFHVLLGQCISKCKDLAGEVHEKAIARILDEIAAKEFFMSGSQVLSELETFCRLSKDKKEFKQEVEKLSLLKLMLTKEPFQHMYAGCVTYLLMPALYATVLPLLFKEGMGAEEKPTEAYYKDNMERAKSMLARDFASSPGRAGERRHTAAGTTRRASS